MLINDKTFRVDVYIDETMKKTHFVVDVQKLTRFAHRSFFTSIFVKFCDAVNDNLDENIFELKKQIKKLKKRIKTFEKTLKTKQNELNAINERLKNAIMFSKLLSMNWKRRLMNNFNWNWMSNDDDTKI